MIRRTNFLNRFCRDYMTWVTVWTRFVARNFYSNQNLFWNTTTNWIVQQLKPQMKKIFRVDKVLELAWKLFVLWTKLSATFKHESIRCAQMVNNWYRQNKYWYSKERRCQRKSEYELPVEKSFIPFFMWKYYKVAIWEQTLFESYFKSRFLEPADHFFDCIN